MAGLFDFTSFLTPVISRLASYIPDPEAKAKAEAEATTEMLNFVADANKQQLAVDAAEANNKSIFVAGWRPFIGWVGGVGLAWQFIGNPVGNWILQVVHPGAAALPQVPMGDLSRLVFAMLGLGGMRTYEKLKGVAPKGAQ